MDEVIEYTGSNGEEIASSMMAFNDNITIEVNDEDTGSDLSLNQVYSDGQVGRDRWRVPLGYSLNVRTGAVFGPDMAVQDYEQLAKEEQ